MSGADVVQEAPAFAERSESEPASGGVLAGRVLAIASLLPALLATAWVVAAFPLAALGWFRPSVAVPLFVVVAAVLVPLGLSLARRSTTAAPWWSVAATGLVAVGFTVFAALSHSEHTIPRRDAGSYAQIGYWLAQHGTPFYQVPVAAFGPSPGVIGFGSPAFYQHGTTLVPQFMTGWPTLLAGADWVGGWTGLLLLPTVIGGCAILAVGGLAARLVGARWAPLAALLTAGAWPVLRSAQETLSEPLALLTLAAGSCLLVDLVLVRHAGAELRRRINRHAFAAGLLLTAGELVRLDFGVDFAFVLPILGWFWLTRRPGVVAFGAGSVLGGALGVLDGTFVTRTYVHVNWASVQLMLVLLGAAGVAVVVAVALLRRRSPRELRWWRPVPLIGAALVVLAGLGLFVRPWVLVDHSTTDPGVASYVETMQRALRLPVDGSRGYAEASLRWVSWYVGWPLLIAALVAAAWLTWRVLHGRELRWLPILLVYLCSSVLVLLRPGITPDHPWADRRLVVEVLPCVILLATWTTAAAARQAVRRRVPWLVALLVAAVLVPAGFALTPVAGRRTEQGEPAASAAVCRLLRPGDTVIVIDPLWMPVIRAQCGLPVAQLVVPSPVAVTQAADSVRAAGRTPVIAGSQLDSPVPLGLITSAVVDLNSRQDQQQLVNRPDGTAPLFLQFWMARV